MSTSTIPLFGRAWKLSVRTPSSEAPTPDATFNSNVNILSQDSWDPNALRVTFDILQSAVPSKFWYGDVTVYNLNKPELLNLLRNANWLTLEAGYQSDPGKSSIIWDGPVLQVMFDRQDVVNLTARFNCVSTTAILENNFMNIAVGPMQSQLQTVEHMIQQLGGNLDDQVSSTAQKLMASKQYIRGKTIFGSIAKNIFDTSEDNQLTAWFRSNQPHISEFDAGTQTVPAVTYGPSFPPGAALPNATSTITRSIIGVPQQTPFGCNFTVLLDPRLQVKVPPMLVEIDQSVISQMKIIYSQLPPMPLDQSGLYIAAQIRHYGDTRGNDWYTEVTGYTRGYAQRWLKWLASAAQAGVQ